MNMPRELGRQLAAKGHEWRHVRDIAMARARDVAILEEARKSQDVVVTHDLDYGHLLAFSGEPGPSVIIFRVRNTHPDNLFRRLMSSWSEIEKPLLEGAIVTVEDATLRIRKLPVLREEREELEKS
jgi:predicted nuclease of predicted toxin-antitoxin system